MSLGFILGLPNAPVLLRHEALLPDERWRRHLLPLHDGQLRVSPQLPRPHGLLHPLAEGEDDDPANYLRKFLTNRYTVKLGYNEQLKWPI